MKLLEGENVGEESLHIDGTEVIDTETIVCCRQCSILL
jgi:hypothetical protein